MSEPALHFEQVVKSYAGSQVLKGIDLSIAQGECVALLGVNGAGKTSLMKCLLNFVALDGGSIRIQGRGHRSPAARAPLAFLPERFLPPYYLSGEGFLKYTLQLQKLPYDPAAVAEVLAALDLDPAALRAPVRDHSKGMTQKLGLAACFLSGKRIYLFDEPMSGLDPKARALLKDHLRLLHGRGATLLFSTHALADVEELCDRVAILHEGALRFVGTPSACRRHYQAATLESAFMACIH